MIKIRNVTKSYNENIVAVNNVSLDIGEGEIVVLLGKSGCGKTTTLKMINRLIDYDSGNIYIQDEEIRNIEPISLRRSIGYVIQSIGLFPHMSIGKNISVVPRLLKWDADKVKTELLNVLNIIKLPESILDRYPHELSGGQKQRIGVARAIIANPKIVLMDEPFGALDPITREELQEEFINLQNVIRKTIVFVTHDIFEAFILADRIAIMDNAMIVQSGSPYELLENPENDFVERFIGKHRESLLSEIKR